MKKKGFTLVELLAVIVILAITLVIAVPKISDVIYLSRKNTFKNSVYALISTAEKLYQESYVGSLNEESVLYDIENGKVLHEGEEVDLVEGKIEGTGFIQIDFEGDSKIALENDKFCAVKQFNEAEVIVSDKEDSGQCGKIYVSLSYNLNGGTTTQNFESSYLEHTKVTLLEPTKENSSFAGWKVIKGNSIIKDNILTIGGKDTIIYALWTKYSALTLNLDGGTISQDFQSTYKSGTTLTLTNPTKEGYTFAGWELVSGNSIISGSNLTMGSEDTILKATWTINTYQINYNLDGGTPGTSAPTSGTYGSTVTISNPSKIGYTFNGWTVTGAELNDNELTIGLEAVTLTANWTINTYTITYNLDSGTFENDMPAEAVYGSTIALESPVREGYVFVGWTVSGNNAILSENNLTIGDGDVTLTVMWVKEITEFAYTGGEQTFIVPTTGYYKIELWGAQGAASVSKGAYVQGVIKASKGEKLYVYVGNSIKASNSTNYNGGTSNSGGYTGGGATDIRLVNGAWNNAEGLNSRIIVAAGSGSGAGNNTTTKGAGGTLRGNSGGGTAGGTQQSFGAVQDSSYTASSFGIANGGCSGGNGYYPGGGATCANGAGGGSSFISGYAGVNAITSSTDRTHTGNTLHYSKRYFINGKMEAGVNEGNGKAKITYVGQNYPKTNTRLNNIRYIKDCINGNTANTANHWTELQATYEGVNVAKGKDIIGTGSISHSSYPYSRITDGDITTNNYASVVAGAQCVTIDLTESYDLDEIAVWHYYGDGRAYKNHSLYVSSDKTNWTTLINNVSGVAETSNGIRISAYD